MPRAGARWLGEQWGLFALGLLVTVVFMLMSPDFGATVDEPIRNEFGQYVLDYLSGRPAEFSRGNRGVFKLYGGLFDTTAAAVHRLAGGDIWTTRHYVNAAFGGIGILAIGLCSARLFGTTAGMLTMLLLALSPRFVGHAMNNPKDAPFAALCSVALLGFTLLRPTFPFVTWPRAILVGLALALPLNVRPGALLYWGYLGLTIAVLYIRAGRYSIGDTATVGVRVAVITIVMLLAGCIFWPWAQGNPLVRPFQALADVGRFPWLGRTLFLGTVVIDGRVPPSYVPVWMSITIPPVVLAGAVASIAALVTEPRRRLIIGGLWFVVLFPIASAIAFQSTLYNEWRHLLFVYPPLVVLAAVGWLAVWERARLRLLRPIVVALFVLGCAEPLWFMIRNHPYPALYFNALVGGPKGAAGRFEMAYWGHDLMPPVEWSAELGRKAGVPLRITAQRSLEGPVRANARRFPSLIDQSARHGTHHLEVRRLRSRQPIPPHALHVTRMADGTLLAAVLAGPKYNDVRGRIEPHLQ